MSALAAARDNDRSGATTHINRAGDSATRLGTDTNHVWTAFGPTNVAIHQTCIAVEFGDIQRAIAIGPSLDTRSLPIERQVRHSIEVARAYARWNRIDEAIGALLSANKSPQTKCGITVCPERSFVISSPTSGHERQP